MHKNFVKIENIKDWQNLLEKVLFKTFFHNIEWEEFLESQFKWLKFERYIWRDKVLLSLAKVGDKLVSHPFCEYGGPLPLVPKIDFKQFKQDLFSEPQSPVKISFHPYLLNYFQCETESDSISSGRVSYLIEGDINLRKTTRHEIEKAKANNIQVEKRRSRKDLEEFYNLYIQSSKRHRIPAYPFSFFEHFNNPEESEVVLAKKNGEVIAGSVFLFYGKFVHYFQNAIDQKYKELGANYLILWNQIQNCVQEKKLIFDFGGTRIGSSLQTFKEGWGGKKYPIYELRNYSEESSLRESKLRNIFGFLPPFLIKKLSPYLLKYKL